MNLHIKVVGAVITNDGKVLAARRPPHKDQGGLWEFPGGKVENGEQPVDALRREIHEELGCVIDVASRVTQTVHSYPNKTVELTTYLAKAQGTVIPTEHEEIRWLAPHELTSVRWAPADIPTVKELQALFSSNADTQSFPLEVPYTVQVTNSEASSSNKTRASDTTTFRLGELFSGPGGIAKGAQQASVDGTDLRIVHQWANDFDADTVDTYSLNITGEVGSESVIHEDVRELDFSKLKQLGEIDAFAFGFPCNDFSTVGERKGFDGTFGPLYTYGVGVLREFKPLWFVAENVSGLSSNDGGKAFQTILQDLRDSGYRLVPHLYKFEQYGVPQARHRIIIVGIRDDLDVTFRVPSPAPYADVDVSAKRALTDPQIPEWATNQERTRQSANVIERLELIEPGQNAFTAKLPERLQIKTRTKISQIYRRLHPDKPSYTVTGSGGGGTHVYHWKEPRALTNRERARLQTFPDDYVFVGTKESVRKQIGMAVPVKGAQIIFEAILKTFAGIEYDSVDSSLPPID